MYFNKAEGCYKYNPRVCLWSLLHSFLKKKLYYKWTTKAQCFFFLHLYKFSATRGNVGLTFDSSYTSKDTFSNRTNYSDFDSKGELSSIRTVAVCSDRKRSSTSVVWTFLPLFIYKVDSSTHILACSSLAVLSEHTVVRQEFGFSFFFLLVFQPFTSRHVLLLVTPKQWCPSIYIKTTVF